MTYFIFRDIDPKQVLLGDFFVNGDMSDIHDEEYFANEFSLLLLQVIVNSEAWTTLFPFRPRLWTNLSSVISPIICWINRQLVSIFPANVSPLFSLLICACTLSNRPTQRHLGLWKITILYCRTKWPWPWGPYFNIVWCQSSQHHTSPSLSYQHVLGQLKKEQSESRSYRSSVGRKKILSTYPLKNIAARLSSIFGKPFQWNTSHLLGILWFNAHISIPILQLTFSMFLSNPSTEMLTQTLAYLSVGILLTGFHMHKQHSKTWMPSAPSSIFIKNRTIIG